MAKTAHPEPQGYYDLIMEDLTATTADRARICICICWNEAVRSAAGVDHAVPPASRAV